MFMYQLSTKTDRVTNWYYGYSHIINLRIYYITISKTRQSVSAKRGNQSHKALNYEHPDPGRKLTSVLKARTLQNTTPINLRLFPVNNHKDEFSSYGEET